MKKLVNLIMFLLVISSVNGQTNNQNIFAANWYNNIIDVIKITQDGSVIQYWCGGGGQQWGQNEFAKAGSASTKAGITAVSRKPGTWECWWVGADGSVNAMYYYNTNSGPRFYQLAPPRSASVTGGIKSLSRRDDHMEVFWIAPDGAIRGCYFYDQWNGNNELVTYAPPGSASKDGTITGHVLDDGSSMELLYTGPNGQINGVYWYESENKWHPVEYVAAPKANILPNGCVTMYVNANKERKVYWIDRAGNVKKLLFNGQWRVIDQPVATGADPNGCVTAVSRDPSMSEVWYTASDGSIKGASSMNNSASYNSYTLPNSSNRANSIAATTRTWDALEVYWLDKNDKIQSANYYMNVGSWQQNPLSSFRPKAVLSGYIDMHAHPMAHLAFGRKFMHGVPDIGSLMPVDQGCNHNVIAKTVDQALGHCDATHGGVNVDPIFGAGNFCGDDIRNIILKSIEKENIAQSNHGKAVGGKNNKFKEWPAYNDISHQTMWVDWVRRTYEHGLRVMVALSVNNQTMAAGLSGPGDGPIDDKASSDLQIEEMKKFVQRNSSFMEIAYTPSDLRRIVSSNKLAIILGIEVDNIGNFNAQIKAGQPVTEAMVSNEIQRLYTQGIRYIFPIHVNDNAFGGTAIYTDGFSVSNKREYGRCWDITCASPADGITYKYNPAGIDIFKDPAAWIKIGEALSSCQTSPNCPNGHINSKGLTSLGEFAIKEMMKRGMIIDIDHMSQKAVNRVLDIALAQNYPMASGHNSLRHISTKTRAENQRTIEQVRKIAASGGMIGVGWDEDAITFRNQFNAFMKITNNKACGLGTDMNGLVKAPKKRAGSNVVYDNKFKPCTWPTNSSAQNAERVWNYNSEGVAHYGLIPDFLKDVKALGGDRVIQTLNSSAEDFVQMWTKCEWRKGSIK